MSNLKYSKEIDKIYEKYSIKKYLNKKEYIKEKGKNYLDSSMIDEDWKKYLKRHNKIVSGTYEIERMSIYKENYIKFLQETDFELANKLRDIPLEVMLSEYNEKIRDNNGKLVDLLPKLSLLYISGKGISHGTIEYNDIEYAINKMYNNIGYEIRYYYNIRDKYYNLEDEYKNKGLTKRINYLEKNSKDIIRELRNRNIEINIYSMIAMEDYLKKRKKVGNFIRKEDKDKVVSWYNMIT